MKRYRVFILIGFVALVISALLLPTGSTTSTRKGDKKTTSSKRLPSTTESSSRVPVQASSEPTPETVHLAGFAESAPVSTLQAAQPIVANNQPGPPEIGETEPHEMNERNTERVHLNLPGISVDGALQSSLRGPSGVLAPSVLPAPSLTFEGIDASDEGNSVAPPDTNGDVGPNDYVQTVNNRVRVWDKNGNPRGAAFTQSSLFGALGGICSVNNNGDPVVLYDRLANRWLISQFAFTALNAPPYHECIAISKTPDPTGSYFLYDFVLPGTEFPDYPKFGVWPDGYYMTSNQFNNGGPFDGAGAYAFQRQKMLVGDPTAVAIYFNLNLASHPEGIFGMLPSDHDGLLPPPTGEPNVFVYFTDTDFGDPADGLRLFEFHPDYNTPFSSFFERAESTYAAPLPLAAFDARDPNGRGDIEQPPPAGNDATDSLDSVASRLMFRLQYINRGGLESLVGNFTVNVSGVAPTTRATYQAGIRYFELRKSTPTGAYTVNEEATFAPGAGDGAAGPNRWMGSAAMDVQGNLAVGYSLSSTTVFPSVNYAARAFNDPPGGLFQGEGTLFAGTNPQRGTQNRWGDYSALVIDPSDDCTFWDTNEYYSRHTPAGFDWQTRIGRFKFATCNAPQQGTLSGTITACDSGVPLDGATVTVSGGPSSGFSTTTVANGTYSMKLAPGSYTVTIASTPHGCTAAGPFNVVISDASITTLNACLTGTPNTAFVSSAVSGGNGNGVIDADECNSLNVTIKSIGCLTASNVSAVLSTSTPNVTITQPNSPYPNLPVGSNGTNTVPFSVSTSPSFVCGTPIAFTLTVNYSGGSNVLNLTLPTCACASTTINGALAAGDLQQTARLGRNLVASSCGTAKVCPGPLGAGPRLYDIYSFPNGPTDACATITLTPSCSAGTNPIISAAYLGSFDPNNLCTNYLGDPGGSPSTGTPISYSVNVPANATLLVNVHEINPGLAGCSGYTVSVSGLVCNTDAGAQCQACAITPPANITVSNNPNQCGAVVNYPAPTSSGTCGVITTSPASGSFFPVGTTTVTATATSGATATFTVTVNDTQAPTITCPANVSVTAPPNVSSIPVTLPAATVSDNCPGTTVGFNPASGSNFNIGTTLVTATATDASGNTASCTFNVTVTQPDAVLFSSATYSVNEGGGSLIATVNRTGGSATAATVDYSTSSNPTAGCEIVNGFASERCDYLAQAGTLKFAAGETSKTIQIFINNDAYVEGSETFTLTLSNPVGTTASVQNTATVTIVDNDSSPSGTNPIDDSTFFVTEQYRSFLNRDPDPGGLAFWVAKITACGSNATCINQQRVSVSLAFFTSVEFQESGFFVYRLYKGALGVKPTYAQFIFDRSQLNPANLEPDKQALTLNFVQRAAFLTHYPITLSGNAFIDALLANVQSSSGLNLTAKKPELITEYLAGTTQADSRARVLRKLVDYPEYRNAEFNSAFVLMQYFGYLNRDIDQGGFDFWLNQLNTGATANSMVCAFITSAEYQKKYNSVVTRTNADCAP